MPSFPRVLTSRPAVAISSAALAVAVFGATGAFAGLSGSDSATIHGCSGPGGVRIVSPDAGCRPNEQAVWWNQTGPAGPRGEQGPAGPPGPQGPAGLPCPSAGCISADDLGIFSVNRQHLASGAVITDALADGSVTAAKLGSGAVQEHHLSPGLADALFTHADLAGLFHTAVVASSPFAVDATSRSTLVLPVPGVSPHDVIVAVTPPALMPAGLVVDGWDVHADGEIVVFIQNTRDHMLSAPMAGPLWKVHWIDLT